MTSAHVSRDARERLGREREQILARVQGLRHDHADFVAASRDSNADDEHDPEGATIAFERAQVEALLRSSSERLADVDAALALVEAGTYGVCERCGRSIPVERLEVRPATRRCVTCAAA